MSTAFEILQTCKFALLPKCQTFETGDRNTGYAQLYVPSGTITGTMTNMASGYGYVHNGGDGYYNFDGTDDFILTDYVNTTLTNLTVFAWAKTTRDTVLQSVIASFAWAANKRAFQLGTWTDGKYLAQISQDGTSATRKLYVGNNISDGNRQCIALTFGSSTLKVYEEGTENTTPNKIDNDAVVSINNSGIATIIGANLQDIAVYSDYWLGQIEGVILFESTLSATDIATLCAAGPSIGGLIGTDNGNGTMSLSKPGLYNLLLNNMRSNYGI